MISYRSSRIEVFFKKGVLKNLAKFTEKHRCQGLFFNEVIGTACIFINKRYCGTGVFLWLLRIFKNTFIYRTPPVAASEVNEETHHANLMKTLSGSFLSVFLSIWVDNWLILHCSCKTLIKSALVHRVFLLKNIGNKPEN